MKKTPYIDNKIFYDAMVEYRESVVAAENNSEEKPRVSEYIGKCFWDIAVGLSYRPNFINYTYKDEMILDAIENCITYCSNFDPSKSKNPFSYFTQIVYYAFVRRIEKEKKHNYVKHKLTANLLDKMGLQDIDNKDYIMTVSDFMRDNTVIDVFEEKMKEKKSISKVTTLEKFME